MRARLFLICTLCCQSVAAAVYKWYDADGNVHFGDSPREGAEEVHVPPPQTYTPPPQPTFTPAAPEPEPSPAYQRFELIAPADDATIRDNTGGLTLSFAVDPGLKTGHQLQILVDGTVRASGKSVTVTLENVERGSHSLQGRIVDGRGKVQIESGSVTVHMHRQSVNLPSRQSPSPIYGAPGPQPPGPSPQPPATQAPGSNRPAPAPVN